MTTEKTKKNEKKYICNNCDFSTSKKTDFDRHTATQKHKNNILTTTNNKENEKHKCENCEKEYNDRAGLWRHKKICQETNVETNNVLKDATPDKELIMMLVKQNSELLEVLKNGTHNNNTTTNSHNKAFNLQFFLNETCKDAMNIMDFVESIQLQLSDLEKMGEIGYVEGISNIIVKNLNALDVSQRPVHCTDKKRETIYIKDQDKWEKDEEQKKIRKVIKKVANKNAMLIQQFKEKHPDYNKYHSKYSTQYHKLIIESFGGSGNNDLEKEDKIIRNISKNIVVDK